LEKAAIETGDICLKISLIHPGASPQALMQGRGNSIKKDEEFAKMLPERF
jgi:hypothetical protein